MDYSTGRRVVRAFSLLAVAVSSLYTHTGRAQNFAIPSFYNEPGYSQNREFSDANGTEVIDPYTGQLHLHYQDLVLRGNGGLDIVVNRTYHSLNKFNDHLEYLSGKNVTGLGWDISFGRVWPGPNLSFFSNTSNPNRTNCRLGGTNVNENPILELPDGSRRVLVSTSSGTTTHAYITEGQWIGKCLMSSDYPGGTAGDGYAPDGGLLAISPEGVKYFFDRYRRVSDGASVQAYHPTKIIHPNGTTLTFTYRTGNSGQPSGSVAWGDFAMINAITGSDGRSVTFNYVNAPGTTNWQKPRLSTIVSGGSPSRTWTYNYLVPSGQSAIELLDNVVRTDGQTIQYEYYTTTGPEKNSLKSAVNPGGGKVRYTYASQTFPNGSVGSQTLTVVSSKINEGSIDPGGTWTYSYTPATSTGTEDVTTMVGPEGCTEYRHRTARTSPMWQEGTLNSVKNFVGGTCSGSTVRTQTYSWTTITLSSAQGRWRAPNNSEGAPYLIPVLSSLSTVQDGSTYSVSYTNYDAFGNPGTKTESSPQDSRTTTLEYFSDPNDLWIKQRLKKETVLSAGSVGGSSVNAVVDRSFSNTNGNLLSETRYSVTTNYQYHTSGTDQGEISRITDANGNVTILDSYKRGIPRTETRKVNSADPDNSPNNITVTRVVNDTGTVASETNGRGKTTSYSYDSFDLLSGVTTPKTTDANISITRSYTSSGITRTLIRGNFEEVRTFDGLGRVLKVQSRDTSSSATVFQFFDYDPLGRTAKVYNPTSSATKPGQYVESVYDALGRVTRIYNPYPVGSSTRTSVEQEYLSDNTVRRTDERGWRITSKYRSYSNPDERDLIEISGPTSTSQPSPPDFRVTQITRNKLGIVTAMQQGVTGDFLSRSFAHDNRFLPDSETHPETGLTDIGTDTAGRVISRQVGSTSLVQYVYDGLDRLKTIDFSAASSTPSADVSTNYDGNGNVVSKTKGTAQWDYIYDDNDNLEYETLTVAGSAYQVHYEYNSLDALQRVTYPSGLVVDYSPNALGRPTQVGSYVNSLAYHPNGQIQSIGFANGHIETISQDERLLPKSFQVGRGGFPLIVSKLYGYDAAANVNAITDYVSGAQNKVLDYNGWNEITTANGPWGSGSFSYDKRANLKTKNMGVLGNLTLNYSSANRISSVNGDAYSYDGFSNVTSRQVGGRVFVYDDSSSMTRANAYGSLPQVDYSYDGNSQRARELITGTLDRRALYNKRGLKLYERETINGEEIDYIYLGSRLITARSRCTSTTDSDGDGIPNCAEARTGMSPNSAGDAAIDNDGDGLTNLQEYQAGTLFNNADTDADGISDKFEVQYALGALTSNASADADSDSLTNLQEYQLGTSPTDSDTDNDGIPDGQDPNPRFNPATLIPILQMILE